MSTTTKNLIFVTGNVVGEYKAIAQELALNLYKSVYLDSPCSAAYHYKTTKDLAAERSYFFSQVLFYGSLPSRKNIVVSIPDLTMKNILQFLILFENVKKNVFVVVDDHSFITTFGKEKYTDLVKRLPMGVPTSSQISAGKRRFLQTQSTDSLRELCLIQTQHQRKFSRTSTT